MRFFAGIVAGIFIALAVVAAGGYVVYQKLLKAQQPPAAAQAAHASAQQQMQQQATQTALPSSPQELLAFIGNQLAQNPQNPLLHMAKATTLAQLGRHNEAMASYTNAIAQNPNYADAYFNRGVSNVNLDRFNNAMGDFATAANIYGKNNNTQGALKSQNAFKMLKDYDKAAAGRAPGASGKAQQTAAANAAATKAAQDIKNAPMFKQPDANINQKLSSQLKTQLDALSAHRTNTSDSFKNAAKNINFNDLNESSFKTFGQSIADAQKNTAQMLKDAPKTELDFRADAQNNMRQGKYEDAIKNIDDALKTSPKDASLHMQRAKANMAQKNVEGAIKDLNNATQADPQNAEAKYQLAQALAQTGDSKTAAQNAQAAADIFAEQGNNDAQKEAQNLANLLKGEQVQTRDPRFTAAANAYNKQDFKTAADLFKQIAQSDPKNERAQYNLNISEAGLASQNIEEGQKKITQIQEQLNNLQKDYQKAYADQDINAIQKINQQAENLNKQAQPIMEQINQNAKTALQHRQEAIKRSPHDGALDLSAARDALSFSQPDIKTAEDHLKAAEQKKADPKTLAEIRSYIEQVKKSQQGAPQ